jgi:REP element-mobilizing transposase RayT
MYKHTKRVVGLLPTEMSADLAKPANRAYKRNLPHLQAEARPLFVSFSTRDRWILPEDVRGFVLQHCLYDHGRKICLHVAIIMPDYVHLIFTPLRDSYGNIFGIAEIMNGIKGASAHTVNKVLNRKGSVWQEESFDHILRTSEKLEEEVEYICNNPVRKGLVKSKKDYPWLWGNPELKSREFTAEGGCAT